MWLIRIFFTILGLDVDTQSRSIVDFHKTILESDLFSSQFVPIGHIRAHGLQQVEVWRTGSQLQCSCISYRPDRVVRTYREMVTLRHSSNLSRLHDSTRMTDVRLCKICTLQAKKRAVIHATIQPLTSRNRHFRSFLQLSQPF